MSYYPDHQFLTIPGYEIYFTRFADSIINAHFSEAKEELTTVLNDLYIPDATLMAGGGNKSEISSKLDQAFYHKQWDKLSVENMSKVGNRQLPTKTYAIDHLRRFARGGVGLKVLWNTKDPFFDRDLSTFKTLHELEELGVGIFITRGASLQAETVHVFERFLNSIFPFDMAALVEHLDPSKTAQKSIQPYLKAPQDEQVREIARLLNNSKFGATTTNMEQLLKKIDQGIGSPCPLMLIGIGKERLTNN